MSSADLTFMEARPLEEDARRILRWRNDPVTLRASFHRRPKEWPSFWNEYLTSYMAPTPPVPRFACIGGQPVAFLRFLPYPEEPGVPPSSFDISINVDPACRGRGKGSRIIRAATEEMLEGPARAIVAEIRASNEASIRAFRRAGYRLLDERVKSIADTGEQAPIVRYIARRSEVTS